MLKKDQLDIFVNLCEQYRKIADEKLDYPINEGAEIKFKTVEELGEFLLGKKLPVMRNSQNDTDSFGYFNFKISVLPDSAKNDAEGINLSVYKNIYGDRVGLTLYNMEQGINVGTLVGNYQKVDGADFKSNDEIIDMCDYGNFFTMRRKNAMDMLGKRFMIVKQTLSIIESYRDETPRCPTLWVSWDKRRCKNVMHYNPRFILSAALDEWATTNADHSGHNIYKNFGQCYDYVMAFLFAHEMSHIIRHNTPSNLGETDLSTIDHLVDNIIEDSFINMSLKDIFTNTLSDRSDGAILGSGIGDQFCFRSHMGGGFKKFDSLDELMGKLNDTFANILKCDLFGTEKYIVPRVQNQASNYNISDWENAKFFIKFYVGNRDISGAVTTFTKLINEIMKTISDKKIYAASQGMTKEEQKELGKDAVQEPEEKISLVGKKVRDEKTGRIGVVIKDDWGTLDIAFPKDAKDISTLLDAVNSGKDYSNLV